jgi:hypothetical protein
MAKPGKAEKWAARGERLKAALRENLKRRRAQARGRAVPATGGDSAKSVPEPEPGAPDFRRNRGSE